MSAGRSPWAGVGSASIGRGCVRGTAVRCRWLPMSCSAAARSWVGWRWARCSVACRAAVPRSTLGRRSAAPRLHRAEPPQGRGDGRQLPAVAHLVGTPGQVQLARPQEPGAIAEGCSETCRVAAAKASYAVGHRGDPHPSPSQPRAKDTQHTDHFLRGCGLPPSSTVPRIGFLATPAPRSPVRCGATMFRGHPQSRIPTDACHRLARRPKTPCRAPTTASAGARPPTPR